MKNFATMTTKKLNALLETANDEDKAAIQEVLNERNQVNVAAATTEDEQELTAEELEAIKHAEENNGENPMHKSAKPRMTDEERETLAKQLKEQYLHHKCQVVLHGTVIWADGYIAGVIEEKRANTVMYRIKLTETGRTMHKAYDSELLKISDEIEIVERKVIRREGSKIDKSQPWTEEAIAEELEKYQGLIGLPCEVVKNGETVKARISGLVPEKRQRTILVRIAYETAEGTKYMHKVAHDTIDGVVLLEADDKTQELNNAWLLRNSKEAKDARKTKAAPQERVFDLTAKLEAANKALQAAQARVEKITAMLAEAQAELDSNLNTESEDLA